MEEERELIRVNLTLPAAALEGLSRLTEQLRLLAAAAGRLPRSSGTAEGFAESGSFDPERFRALRRLSEGAAPPAPRMAGEEIRTVRGEISEETQEPAAAGRAVEEHPAGPVPAGPAPGENAPAAEPAAQTAGRPGEETPAEEALPAGPAPGDPPAEVQAVREGADGPVPEAETVRARAEVLGMPPAAVRAEVPAGPGTPPGAGAAAMDRAETAAESRWDGGTGERVPPGPGPLTAETLSRALQRDARRYDGGFPLY